MKKERLQANFRIEEKDRDLINELRRSIQTPDGKVPSESYIWRQALRDMFERKRKGKRP